MATIGPFFIPSAALGYTAQQVELTLTQDFLRMQWIIPPADMGTDITNLVATLPIPVQAVSALVVGPNSDLDRYFIVDAKEHIFNLTSDQESNLPLAASVNEYDLFSVDAPFSGRLSVTDRTTPLRIVAGRAFNGAYFQGTAPFIGSQVFGLTLDVIAFLAGAPKQQPLRVPRTLAFGCDASMALLHKVAAMPVCGRKRKTVILNNHSGAPIGYKIVGSMFNNAPNTGVNQPVATLSSGNIPATAAGVIGNVIVSLDQYMIDGIEVFMDCTDVQSGGQIVTFD